ncbi:hypothetical protein ACFLQ0_00705 [Nitrospinota bacterium]
MRTVGRWMGTTFDTEFFTHSCERQVCVDFASTASGTHGPLFIQNGESLAYIRDQLGHSSIQVTVGIYGHLVPGAKREAEDRLDDATYTQPRKKKGLRISRNPLIFLVAGALVFTLPRTSSACTGSDGRYLILGVNSGRRYRVLPRGADFK